MAGRDGITKAEIEQVTRDLNAGKPWDEAVKRLDGVDPKVIAVNKDALIRLAEAEKTGRHIPPPPKDVPQITTKAKPTKKSDDIDPLA